MVAVPCFTASISPALRGTVNEQEQAASCPLRSSSHLKPFSSNQLAATPDGASGRSFTVTSSSPPGSSRERRIRPELNSSSAGVS
jgi:hypothetical protein